MKRNELFATILSLENEVEDLTGEKISVNEQKKLLKKLKIQAKNQFRPKDDVEVRNSL
jgi:hypothetical protein